MHVQIPLVWTQISMNARRNLIAVVDMLIVQTLLAVLHVHAKKDSLEMV